MTRDRVSCKTAVKKTGARVSVVIWLFVRSVTAARIREGDGD